MRKKREKDSAARNSKVGKRRARGSRDARVRKVRSGALLRRSASRESIRSASAPRRAYIYEKWLCGLLLGKFPPATEGRNFAHSSLLAEWMLARYARRANMSAVLIRVRNTFRMENLFVPESQKKNTFAYKRRKVCRLILSLPRAAKVPRF